MTGGVNTQMITKTAYSNYDGKGTKGDGNVDYNEGKKGSIFDSAQLKNENVTPANFNQEYGIKAPGLSDLKNFNTTQLFEGFLQKQFGVFNSGSKEVTGANEADAEAQRVAASKELDGPVEAKGKSASKLANDDLQNAYQNAVNEEYDAEVNKANDANELPFYVEDDTSKDKNVSYDEASQKLADAMDQDLQERADNQAEGSNSIDITQVYTDAVQDFSQDYFTGKEVSADTAQGAIDNAIQAKAEQGNQAVREALGQDKAADEDAVYIDMDTNLDSNVNYDEAADQFNAILEQNLSSISGDGSSVQGGKNKLTKTFNDAVKGFSQDYYAKTEDDKPKAEATVTNAIFATAAKGIQGIQAKVNVSDTSASILNKDLFNAFVKNGIKSDTSDKADNAEKTSSSSSVDGGSTNTQSHALKNSHIINEICKITGVNKSTLENMNSFNDQQVAGKEKIGAGTEVNLPSSVRINAKMLKLL